MKQLSMLVVVVGALIGRKGTGCTVPRLQPRSLSGVLSVIWRLRPSGASEGGSQAGGKFAGQGGCGAVVEVIRQGINSSIRLIGCPTAILVRISLR